MTKIPDEFLFGRVFPVVRWVPDVDQASDHHALSDYVESFWLPVLGPSTILLVRFLARSLVLSPMGFDLDVAETARALGLSERTGRHAPFMRTVSRAVDFALIRFEDHGVLAARTRLPELTEGQLWRLPRSLRIAHLAMRPREPRPEPVLRPSV